MKIDLTRLAVVSLSLCFTSLSFAHSGHVHKAPLIACQSLSKGESCRYMVGKDKVYKGTCQLFEETLMCVRNQPIEYLTPLSDPELASVKDNESITLQK